MPEDRVKCNAVLELIQTAKKRESIFGRYGDKHRDKKYEMNDAFLEKIKPKTVLDSCCGAYSYYKRQKRIKAFTNDLNPTIEADEHKDMFALLSEKIGAKERYDLVDIDPFVGAEHVWPLALIVAKKGIAVSFPDLASKRFGNSEGWAKRFMKETSKEVTPKDVSSSFQNLARLQGVVLKEESLLEEGGFARGYYSIVSSVYNMHSAAYFGKMRGVKAPKEKSAKTWTSRKTEVESIVRAYLTEHPEWKGEKLPFGTTSKLANGNYNLSGLIGKMFRNIAMLYRGSKPQGYYKNESLIIFNERSTHEDPHQESGN